MPRAAGPAALLLSIVMAAAAVRRYAAPPGGLQLPTPQTDREASSATAHRQTAIGALDYPRYVLDVDGSRVRISHPARRIASEYWSIDEYVYAVSPASEVVAVSASAYEPSISNVLSDVKRYRPVVAADPERVLKLDPDLILLSSSSRADLASLLRNSGSTVFRMQTNFETLQEVEDTIRLTGYLTGHDQEAEQVQKAFRNSIDRARARIPRKAAPPRILGLGGEYSYGKRTLFDDVAKTLGTINVGSEGGLVGYAAVSFEQILRWDPQWIFAEADPGKTGQVLQRLRSDPALALTRAARDGHIVVLENTVFLPMSPYTAALVNAIADALYPSSTNRGQG